MSGRRLAVALVVMITALVGAAGPAAADPAGPTDYRSEIILVEPPVAGMELRMIGGDSFLELRAPAGVRIEVVGYQGEDYLRFEADGTVWENRASPSWYLNEDRFAETEIPPEITADGEPDWVRVSTDGTYAWHDHRTHWMNEARPPGAEPGDQILEAEVPIVVDGERVSIVVASFLQPDPSNVPALAGVVVAALLLVALWRWARGWSEVAVALAALAATALGTWAVWSVPAETGPPRTLWLLPAVALISALAALAVPDRGQLRVIRNGLALLAALELAAWVWTRWDAVGAAIIPTDAPGWLDRAVILGVGTTAVVVAVVSTRRLARPS